MSEEAARREVLETLANDWRLLRNHHPVGAYLPVGQLDGDCRCGRGAWPCDAVYAALGLHPCPVCGGAGIVDTSPPGVEERP